MRRPILSLLLTILFAGTAQAQQPALDTSLQAYLEFCLAERAALYPLDCQRLEECIAESDATTFVYHATTIVLGENATFQDLDSPEAASMRGHAFFRTDYVDSVLTACVLPENIDEPIMKRGNENCFIVHRALAPHATGIYSFEGADDMQLFVVADFGHVRVTVCNEEGTADQFHLVAESNDDFPAAVLKWNMGAGKIIIRVQNISDVPIGFVVASN